METKSCTDLRDLIHGGSFSFSCSESDLHFSSLSHFTDDDASDDGDDDEYIEIALDHHHRDSEPARGDDQGGDDDDVGGIDHADYLRISFSSSLLPELPVHGCPNVGGTENDKENVTENGPVKHTTSSSASCSLSSCSMESSCGGPVEESDDSSRVNRSYATKGGRLPAVNRLVNTLLFGLRSSSELPVNEDNAGLARSSKTTNIRTSINGGLMKLLFKFRAMNLGSLVASLVKPRQVDCSHGSDHQANIKRGPRNTKKSKQSTSTVLQYHQKLVKPLDKLFVQKKQPARGMKPGTTKNSYSSEVIGAEKPRVLLEIRGVLEAIGNSMSSGISRKERTKSCPSSIKSSPLHHQGLVTSHDQNNKVYVYARETSIQAAIAHCKTSFEQKPSII